MYMTEQDLNFFAKMAFLHQNCQKIRINKIKTAKAKITIITITATLTITVAITATKRVI